MLPTVDSAHAGARWEILRRFRCRNSRARFGTSRSTPRSATSSSRVAILGRLRQISHLEIIRIGSRVPCHLPERITPELCEMLKKHHPLYINTHFNHPAELTPAAVKCLGMLADAGIPLGCQTVLLRGVNDYTEIMTELMNKLLAARVRPYYIYMCDNVAGVEHFKTSVEKGLEIVQALRGWTSGLAVPHFVIDAPGGGGKIPLIPEYVEEITEDEVIMKNFRGERYVWTQPRKEAVVGSVLPFGSNSRKSQARRGKKAASRVAGIPDARRRRIVTSRYSPPSPAPRRSFAPRQAEPLGSSKTPSDTSPAHVSSSEVGLSTYASLLRERELLPW